MPTPGPVTATVAACLALAGPMGWWGWHSSTGIAISDQGEGLKAGEAQVTVSAPIAQPADKELQEVVPELAVLPEELEPEAAAEEAQALRQPEELQEPEETERPEEQVEPEAQKPEETEASIEQQDEQPQEPWLRMEPVVEGALEPQVASAQEMKASHVQHSQQMQEHQAKVELTEFASEPVPVAQFVDETLLLLSSQIGIPIDSPWSILLVAPLLAVPGLVAIAALMEMLVCCFLLKRCGNLVRWYGGRQEASRQQKAELPEDPPSPTLLARPGGGAHEQKAVGLKQDGDKDGAEEAVQGTESRMERKDPTEVVADETPSARPSPVKAAEPVVEAAETEEQTQ